MKNADQIRSLLRKSETHNVEFKVQFSSDKIGQTISAFANDWPETGGGIIIIGIDDKKKAIVGHNENADKLQRDISSVCRSGAMVPDVAPMIYEVQLEQPIMVIEVLAITNPPCRYKDLCYIRIGSTNQVASFQEEVALHKKASTGSATTGPLLDKLPPREGFIDSFIGRQAELDELWLWFKDTTITRRALAGDGGKGKTAIAYEFAQRIAEASPKPYDIVLWASAKRKQFVSGRTVPISNPDFNDLDSLLDKLLVDIGYPEETTSATDEKSKKVLELLDTFPALIVIDDLNSIDWASDQATMDFVTFHTQRVRFLSPRGTKSLAYLQPLCKVSQMWMVAIS
jgi:hypothetical protein